MYKEGGQIVEEDTEYDCLPLNVLVGYYYYINKNIKKGILSNAMYYEIDLMKQAANRKGISLDYCYKRGTLMVKIEQQIK